jgi:hypothetical protein
MSSPRSLHINDGETLYLLSRAHTWNRENVWSQLWSRHVVISNAPKLYTDNRFADSDWSTDFLVSYCYVFSLYLSAVIFDFKSFIFMCAAFCFSLVKGTRSNNKHPSVNVCKIMHYREEMKYFHLKHSNRTKLSVCHEGKYKLDKHFLFLRVNYFNVKW